LRGPGRLHRTKPQLVSRSDLDGRTKAPRQVHHDAAPGLLVSATDVEEGQIKYFYSHEDRLSVDHIVASGSLPPSFPMTPIDGHSYWDGGLFDNTPLGAVLDRLDQTAGADRGLCCQFIPEQGAKHEQPIRRSAGLVASAARGRSLKACFRRFRL
jgi:predicted acylesterase/phospholipase RssA